MSTVFNKHPSETYPIGLDFTGKAPTGSTLASGVWSATDMNDLTDASATVLQSTGASIAGSVAKVRVKNGELDHLYKLSLTATFDSGDVLHDNIYMHVTDGG